MGITKAVREMTTYEYGRVSRREKPYRARAKRNGQTFNLGYFRTFMEARAAEAQFDATHPRKARGKKRAS